MEDLIRILEGMKKSRVKFLVDSRISDFKEIGKKSIDQIFTELCFCIMAANFNAERSIKIQNEIKQGFCHLSENRLAQKLKKLGYRFPNIRAKYITEAKKQRKLLRSMINDSNNESELREWLVENVKGLGYKEASHFLRNIGYTNLAIIDFHIIDVLSKHKLIKKSKTLTKRKYLEIEGILRKIARKLNLNLAELDLYLWYLETGKILK